MLMNLQESKDKVTSIWNAASPFWQDENGELFKNRGINSLLEILSEGIDCNQAFEQQLNLIEDHLDHLTQKIASV